MEWLLRARLQHGCRETLSNPNVWRASSDCLLMSFGLASLPVATALTSSSNSSSGCEPESNDLPRGQRAGLLLTQGRGLR